LRKTISIALVFLILLNTIGYYGLFLGWQYKSDQEVINKLEFDEFSYSESITIRIPIMIPYASDSREFEPAHGKFEHEGEFYHLVKRKLYRDTLYTVCVRDNQSKEIHLALTDYVKTFTDEPIDVKSSGTKSVPTLIKDYISDCIGLKSQDTGWEKVLHYSHVEALHPVTSSRSVYQPPEG
jgi:hypothetical protein